MTVKYIHINKTKFHDAWFVVKTEILQTVGAGINIYKYIMTSACCSKRILDLTSFNAGKQQLLMKLLTQTFY